MFLVYICPLNFIASFIHVFKYQLENYFVLRYNRYCIQVESLSNIGPLNDCCYIPLIPNLYFLIGVCMYGFFMPNNIHNYHDLETLHVLKGLKCPKNQCIRGISPKGFLHVVEFPCYTMQQSCISLGFSTLGIQQNLWSRTVGPRQNQWC